IVGHSSLRSRQWRASLLPTDSIIETREAAHRRGGATSPASPPAARLTTVGSLTPRNPPAERAMSPARYPARSNRPVCRDFGAAGRSETGPRESVDHRVRYEQHIGPTNSRIAESADQVTDATTM